MKDLSRLGRSLEQTIIVDNSIHAFALQISNGIPIPSFFGQSWDTELYQLVSNFEIRLNVLILLLGFLPLFLLLGQHTRKLTVC